MLPGVQDPQGWLWPGGPTPTRGIRTVREQQTLTSGEGQAAPDALRLCPGGARLTAMTPTTSRKVS